MTKSEDDVSGAGELSAEELKQIAGEGQQPEVVVGSIRASVLKKVLWLTARRGGLL